MSYSRSANINFPIILRILGWLLIIEAGFMVIPLITGIICHSTVEHTEVLNDDGIKGFSLSIAITLFSGIAMALGITPSRNSLEKREAILLTTLVWVFFSLFGMLPFLFCETQLTPIDCFFEAVSGFSTTGATVIRDVEIMPHSILIWRSVMQWIGGMGIILFTLAVLPIMNNQAGMQLFNAEISGITQERLSPRVNQNSIRIWGVYIVLTLITFVLLVAGPMDLFDAICHAMSTTATGGFSTKNASIGYWDSTYITVVTIIFMFLGGTNFQLIYLAFNRKPKALLKNDTFHWYIIIVAVVSLLAAVTLYYSDKTVYSWSKCLINAIFQTVSGITSSGFLIDDYNNWSKFVHLLFMVIMFFGACAGSTSSGAKLDRLVVLLKNTKNEFFRMMHPNTVRVVRVNNKVIPSEAIYKMIAFLALYLIIIVVSWAVLTLCGTELDDALFASISCISNIGYGVGQAANGSFMDIALGGKCVLIFLMLAGRLELFTFLVIFTRYFWRK